MLIEKDFSVAQTCWTPSQMAIFKEMVNCSIDLIACGNIQVLLDWIEQTTIPDELVAFIPRRAGKTTIIAAAMVAFARTIPRYSAIAIVQHGPSNHGIPCPVIEMCIAIEVASRAMENARPIGAVCAARDWSSSGSCPHSVSINIGPDIGRIMVSCDMYHGPRGFHPHSLFVDDANFHKMVDCIFPALTDPGHKVFIIMSNKHQFNELADAKYGDGSRVFNSKIWLA